MDGTAFLTQFMDHLAPTLDTYEQAIYLYVARHSRLVGQPEAVIGFKSARKAMAFGIGKAGTPMSETQCYEKLRSLERKGCLAVLGTERAGTRVRAFLPSEMRGLIRGAPEAAAVPLDQLDFSEVPENRLRILAREDGRCFYCLRTISAENYVIEHTTSRPDGDNTYRNVVAACRQCNNRKGNAGAEAFLRSIYRDGLLDADDLQGRLAQLAKLREGALVPPIA